MPLLAENSNLVRRDPLDAVVQRVSVFGEMSNDEGGMSKGLNWALVPTLRVGTHGRNAPRRRIA